MYDHESDTDLSSQMMTTLSPRLTCFSLEPRIAALGWWIHNQLVSVLTPVDVAAWVQQHDYYHYHHHRCRYWWYLALVLSLVSGLNPPGVKNRNKKLIYLLVLTPIVQSQSEPLKYTTIFRVSLTTKCFGHAYSNKERCNAEKIKQRQRHLKNTLNGQSSILVTWDLTLETLITFLTIGNNNFNIYIVTLVL